MYEVAIRHAPIDVMVTRAGRLRFGPLLLATMRTVVPGARVTWVRHEAIEIVTLMLAGSLAREDSLGGRYTLGPEEICLCSTGTGIEHAELAASDEPVHALELWLPARADVAPRVVRRTAWRGDRVGRLCTVAGRGSTLVTAADVTIRAVVLAAGASVIYHSTHRSYLVPTVGRIAIDGVIAERGARVRVRGSGRICVTALDSTEVVALSL